MSVPALLSSSVYPRLSAAAFREQVAQTTRHDARQNSALVELRAQMGGVTLPLGQSERKRGVDRVDCRVEGLRLQNEPPGGGRAVCPSEAAETRIGDSQLDVVQQPHDAIGAARAVAVVVVVV